MWLPNACVFVALVCTVSCRTTDDVGLVEGASWCMTCPFNEPCENILWDRFEEHRGIASCVGNTSTMCISRLRSSDSGVYSCRPKRDAAVNGKAIYIQVFKKDEKPDFELSIWVERFHDVAYLIFQKVDLFDLFTLDWTLPANSTAQRDHRLHFNNDTQLITIANYTDTDNGDYTCIATNPINGQKSEERFRDILVNEQVGPFVADVHAAPGQLVNATCDVRGLVYDWVYWSYVRTGVKTIDEVFKVDEVEWQDLYTFKNYTSTAPDGHENRITIAPSNAGVLSIEAYEPFMLRCTVDETESGRRWHAMTSVYILDLFTLHPAQMFAGNTSAIRCSASVRHITDSLQAYKDGAAVTGSATDGIHLTSGVMGDMYVVTVTFQQIQLRDAGRYGCVAESVTRQRIEQEVDVVVFDAPTFATTIDDDIEVDVGQPLTLECYVTGYPAPTVKWTTESKTASHDIRVINVNHVFLKIDRVAVEHIGTYECEAENDVGRSTHQFNVKTKTTFGLYFLMMTSIVLLTMLLLAIACLLVRREHRKRVQLQRAGITYFIEGNETRINDEISIVDQGDLLPYDTRFDFAKKNLTIGRRLGSGAFGDVFGGVALGIVADEPETAVAVKCVKNRDSNDDIRALIGELKIMIHYGRHLNVLQLLGVVRENLNQRELLVITELCPFGNLREFLRNNRELESNGTTRSISNTDLVCWSYQVSQAMNFLATNGILHGDLAARNVLLTHDNVIRVCDFGLSRRLRFDEDYTKETDVVLPLKWMAIESIEAKTFNSSSDVWSFGVLMWELFSHGASPYATVNVGELLAKLKSGYRLARPDQAHPDLYGVMLDCWNDVSTARPRFCAIGRRLEEFLPGHLVQEFHDRNADYNSVQLDMRCQSKYFREFTPSGRAAPEVLIESIPLQPVDDAEIQISNTIN